MYKLQYHFNQNEKLSWKKMQFKMSSAKCWLFANLNELTDVSNNMKNRSWISPIFVFSSWSSSSDRYFCKYNEELSDQKCQSMNDNELSPMIVLQMENKMVTLHCEAMNVFLLYSVSYRYICQYWIPFGQTAKHHGPFLVHWCCLWRPTLGNNHCFNTTPQTCTWVPDRK